jgi:hypothetical protein
MQSHNKSYSRPTTNGVDHPTINSQTRVHFRSTSQAILTRKLIDIEFGSYVKLTAQVALYLIQSCPILALTTSFGWVLIYPQIPTLYRYLWPRVLQHINDIQQEIERDACCTVMNTCRHNPFNEMLIMLIVGSG